jgi:endonuclease/exonuclease/phosphatase family metal-dependent hydrolase
VAALREAGLTDAYAGREQQKTCVANRRARRIDYLFHTPDLRARPVEPPVIEDTSPLPSAEEPSDHLAIRAAFEWAGP